MNSRKKQDLALRLSSASRLVDESLFVLAIRIYGAGLSYARKATLSSTPRKEQCPSFGVAPRPVGASADLKVGATSTICRPFAPLRAGSKGRRYPSNQDTTVD